MWLWLLSEKQQRAAHRRAPPAGIHRWMRISAPADGRQNGFIGSNMLALL